jgi:hypothetical protein
LLDFTVSLSIQKSAANNCVAADSEISNKIVTTDLEIGNKNCVAADSKIGSKTAPLPIQKSTTNCVAADF